MEDGKCFQANATIPADLFTEYLFNSPTTQIFKINFSIFMDCLDIYGINQAPNTSAIALQMAYGGHGSTLIMM